MAARECRKCAAPIKWGKEEGSWIPLNLDGSPHWPTCEKSASHVCRYCRLPIVWKPHEGKQQCFNPDGVTLHIETCTRRDECAHCSQKVTWTLVEGRWLAFDREVPRELHWNLCPKNPEAAKDLIKRVIELQAEVDRVKERNKALEADVRVREVELRRLTRKVEKVEQPS